MHHDASQTPAAIIRPVEIGDEDAWSSLRAELWPTAKASELADQVRSFLIGRPPATIAAAFVAETDQGELSGFIEVGVRSYSDGCDSSPVPHIEGWYVKPALRARGVGKALMRSAEHWAKSLGFREIASDTEINNAASLRAHEACGFQEVERLIKLRKDL